MSDEVEALLHRALIASGIEDDVEKLATGRLGSGIKRCVTGLDGIGTEQVAGGVELGGVEVEDCDLGGGQFGDGRGTETDRTSADDEGAVARRDVAPAH